MANARFIEEVGSLLTPAEEPLQVQVGVANGLTMPRPYIE